MNKKLVVNKSNKIFLQCSTPVGKSGIRRETINGVEHIVITSYTLPADIVMNGGLYPKEERDKSYITLNRTLAPLEHPQDSSGNYISANDPYAINNYYAGVYNDNAEIDGDRIKIEKYINVQEALKSERGKRVLDRINEIETSSNPRPIHTSVGVFIEREDLEEPMMNAMGQEYSWIASNMFFDHDAILLDSVGAAQPSQGVGIGVNADGEEFEVQSFVINTGEVDFTLASEDQKWVENAAKARWEKFSDDVDSGYLLPNEKKFLYVDVIDGEAKAVPNALKQAFFKLNKAKLTAEEKDRIQEIVFNKLGVKPVISYLEANELSFGETIRKAHAKLNPSDDFVYWIEEIWDNKFVYCDGDKFFYQEYEVLDEEIEFVGPAVEVERETTFKPVTNQKGDAMREMMLNALKAAGISVNADITDEELLAEYSKLQANQSSDNGSDNEGNDDIAEVVANALKPLTDRLDSMETKLTANQVAETDHFVKVIANSGKYPDLSEDDIKALPEETIKKMAANCSTSHGLPIGSLRANQDDDSWAGYEMPK